jgi:KaiC/GvpD/RAD55 family RecA-like ATPase
MDRVATGITGLDDLIEGGFPRGRTILVSGGCGTGKSILGLQYLYKGAVDYGEPGVYVTVDQNPELSRQDMLRFGWDLKRLEDEGKLAILDLTASKTGMASQERFQMTSEAFDIGRFILKITTTASEIGAKRIVIDSLPALGLRMKDENEIRAMILQLTSMIRHGDMTALLITETNELSPSGIGSSFSKYGVEEYVSDGVITMHYTPMANNLGRTLNVRKLRGTKHAEESLAIRITDKGIVIIPPDEAFSV